ncbi:MAG: hypothetical protein WB779_08790 [Ignavibacteriaceae bacterium]
MNRSVLFWIIAIIITILSAYYQRVTGPTYPISGKITIENEQIIYHLDRSHNSTDDCTIKVDTKDNLLSGILEWKRFKTNDDFTKVEMTNNGGVLSAPLPKQPPAGKLQYRVILNKNNESYEIPTQQKYVVIRYKGEVPLFILIPHILAMFGTMLLSTRTGLEVFNKEPRLKLYTAWTIGFLIFGGMILGPLTQLYAFGALWTGFPFGFDLTDNKTLIALIGWLIAAFMLKRSKKPGWWIVGASVLLFIVYLIPHSVLGSELDYNKVDRNKSQTKIINQN